MTDSLPTPADAVSDADGWQPLPAAARTVSGIAGALYALPVAAAAGFTSMGLLEGWPLRIGAMLGVLALAALAGAAFGRARWRRTRWRLDARGLQVRRGLVWQNELLVPRSRVQHLDLERGPIERRFGLATLVVHTAGTRLHALRQAGFLDEQAVALRDALLPEQGRDDDTL